MFQGDILIIDISNIRDDRIENPGFRDGKAFSLEFLDGFLAELSSIAPAAVMIKIAGRAILNPSLWREKSDFKKIQTRTKLHITDPEYIYVMPAQADGFKHIKADDLILELAEQFCDLDISAFILSKDEFREPKYSEKLRKIGDRHFKPVLDSYFNSWSFEPWLHDEAISYDTRQLKDRIDNSNSMDIEGEDEIREHVFNDLIISYLELNGITSVTSERPARMRDWVLSPTAISKIRDFFKPPELDKQRLEKDAPIFEHIAAQVFAFAGEKLERFVGEFIEVIGRLRLIDNDAFLEGIPGDSAIRLTGYNVTAPTDYKFCRVSGKIVKVNGKFVLKRVSNSIYESVNMAEALGILGDDEKMQSQLPIKRQWLFPPLSPRVARVKDTTIIGRQVPVKQIPLEDLNPMTEPVLITAEEPPPTAAGPRNNPLIQIAAEQGGRSSAIARVNVAMPPARSSKSIRIILVVAILALLGALIAVFEIRQSGGADCEVGKTCNQTTIIGLAYTGLSGQIHIDRR